MTTVIPETSEELEEFLHDDKRLAGVLKDGQFGEFTQAYISKSMESQRAELAAQMREQLDLGKQQIMQTWAEQGIGPASGWKPGAGAAVKGRDARRNKAVARASRRLPDAGYLAEAQFLFSESAMGAGVDEEPYAKSMRAFLYEMIKAEHVARDQGDNDRVARVQASKKGLYERLRNAAMSERIPSGGGFLVPEVLRSEILMFALEQSVVRPRARVIPMDSLRVPLPTIDDTSHSSNVYGGVAAYWTAEGATLSATAPKWGAELEARKLTAYTTIPNELLQDSITPLDTWFNMFFPRAMAWFEDIAFISGTGVGEPQGFLNSPAAIKVSAAADNVLTYTDLVKAYTRMWPQSLNSAVWLCSPDTLLQLLQLAVTAQSATSSVQPIAPPGWLTMGQAIETPGGGNNDGVNYRLFGRPLVVSEKMPSSTGGSTAGALSFVDLDYYLLGDRQSMQIATSDEYLFASDLVAYRVIERLDGRIWPQSAITPANGSTNTLSPVVIIDTTSYKAGGITEGGSPPGRELEMGMLGLGKDFNFVPIAAGTLIALKDYDGANVFVSGDDTFTLKSAATYNGSATALADISSYWTNTSTSGAAEWVAASQAAGSALTIASGAAYFYVDAADLPASAEYIEVTVAASGLVYVILGGPLVGRTPENLRQLSGSAS